jgi:hypothetical protein
MPPEPPDWLHGAAARAAFMNAYAACVARGVWDPGFTTMLQILAQAAAHYVQLVQEVAELSPETVGDDLRTAVVTQRSLVREFMVEFLLLAPSEIAGGTLRSDGLDVAIAELCDVPAVQ